MILKKVKKNYYLLIKLNSRDAKYLHDHKKYEHPRMIKKTEEYLSKILALHLKAVFVMTAAQLLKEEEIIKPKVCVSSLRELDKSLRLYDKIIDKYFKKFGDLLDSKVFKKKPTN